MVNELGDVLSSLSCSWDPNFSCKILTFGGKDDPEQWDSNGEVIHSILEENFLYLKRPDDGDACLIRIVLNNPSIQVTNVSVVSEAHIFEIYGKYEEYIKTIHGEPLCADGKDFYVSQTGLLTTNEISFKFPGPKKGFWLYGIKLIVKKIMSTSSIFDYNLIDEKIKTSNIPITEKAEKFKKFLQEYGMNKYTANKMDPQMLMKFMEGECMAHLKPVTSVSNGMSKYLSSLFPTFNQNISEQQSENTNSELKYDQFIEQSSALKNYVDVSLQQLEVKLQENFKKQLSELETKQDKKLDAILELLRNSTLS